MPAKTVPSERGRCQCVQRPCESRKAPAPIDCICVYGYRYEAKSQNRDPRHLELNKYGCPVGFPLKQTQQGIYPSKTRHLGCFAKIPQCSILIFRCLRHEQAWRAPSPEKMGVSWTKALKQGCSKTPQRKLVLLRGETIGNKQVICYPCGLTIFLTARSAMPNKMGCQNSGHPPQKKRESEKRNTTGVINRVAL